MTQAFNLSQFANKVNTSGQADLTTAVTGVLPTSNGGTGLSSPGIAGNVLMSNGSVWTSTPIGGYNGGHGAVAYYTSVAGENIVYNSAGSATFTVPAGISALKVTLCGGGGAGAGMTADNVAYMNAGGGGGAYAVSYLTGLTSGATIAVTVGAGGIGVNTSQIGANGGTSSFGTLVTCTGGAGGNAGTGGAGGTVSGTYAIGLPGGAGWNRTSFTYGCASTAYFGGTGGACGIVLANINVRTYVITVLDVYVQIPGNAGMLGGLSGTGRLYNSIGIGQSASGFGNGGAGAGNNSGVTTNYAGGNGSNGIVIIEW